jgi:proteasome lid subunit RPN8/RPN11
MIEMPRTVVRAIEDHAREAFPEECCGSLLGFASELRRVIEARRAKNTAVEDRARRYVIDPLELLHTDEDARAKHLDLIGIYHSHPGHPAVPSEFDRSRAASWYSYVILSIQDGQPGELTSWRYDESTRRFMPEEIRIESGRDAIRKPSLSRKR